MDPRSPILHFALLHFAFLILIPPSLFRLHEDGVALYSFACQANEPLTPDKPEMKIHEYQARQIFPKNGIPVPPAEVVRSARRGRGRVQKFQCRCAW